MTNWPNSVSASAHRPPIVQYTAVIAPVMRMPWLRDMPVKTDNRVAIAAHLAPTSTIFSSIPDHASACWVFRSYRFFRYSSGDATWSRDRNRLMRGANSLEPMAMPRAMGNDQVTNDVTPYV